jgi:hypothetical protein
MYAKRNRFEFAGNGLNQLFKVYIGLESGHYTLNESFLNEVIEAMSILKSGKKVGLFIIYSSMSKIDMNVLQFLLLFKTGHVFHSNSIELVPEISRTIQAL